MSESKQERASDLKKFHQLLYTPCALFLFWNITPTLKKDGVKEGQNVKMIWENGFVYWNNLIFSYFWDFFLFQTNGSIKVS